MPAIGEPKEPTLRVFGPLKLERHGQAVELPQSKKTRALLAYLALGEREYPRSRLISLFWDDVNDGRGALRWSLSRLRTLFEDEGSRVLVADRDTVSLDLSQLRIDWADCRRVAHSLESAPTPDLIRAVACCERELLEDLDLPECPDFQGWLIAARQEASKLRVLLLDRLIERLSGDPEACLPYARQRIAWNRTDEGPHVLLLRLLHATNRHEEAQKQAALCDAWRREQGLPPSRLLAVARHELYGARKLAEKPADRVSPGIGEPRLNQVIRFCKTEDDVTIAYSCIGSGFPILKAANWLSHLELDFESPVWRHWVRELSRSHTFVRYDARGHGLSDANPPDVSFEAYVRDLEAVANAAGLERYALLGISMGCPIAVAHAVRFPERVSHLILFGGFAQGFRARGVQREIELVETLMSLAAQGWGRSNPIFRHSFTRLFFQEGSTELTNAFDELQRRSATAENAVRTIQAIGTMDVTPLLSSVRIPTLVAHAKRDALIPFAEGRKLASGIPGARFLPLESRNHVPLEDEPAWERFLTELREFLGDG